MLAASSPSSTMSPLGYGHHGSCGHAALNPATDSRIEMDEMHDAGGEDAAAAAAIAAAVAPPPAAAARPAAQAVNASPAPQQRKRSVRFHPTTKKNDGLRHTTDMFNEYMRDVFRTAKRPQGQTTVSILARNLNVLGLVTVQKMLANLIWRCDRSRKGRAVVLVGGGGTAGSITRQHIPYLVSHVEYLETVIAKVRTVIARKEARAARARKQQEDANFN